MQLSPNLFKLTSGPFKSTQLNQIKVSSDHVVYQPHFWDFLNPTKNSEDTLIGAQSITFTRKELHSLLRLSTEISSQKPKIAWQNVESFAFKKQFDWSQLKFRESKLEKAVPIISQICQTHFSVSNLVWMIGQLLSEEHFGWAYGFWQNGEGYLGQTPELIAEWNRSNGTLKTHALAGTRWNGPGEDQKIMNDEKVYKEHQYVVSDISEKLNSILPVHQIQQTEVHVLKLKHLLHLKTDFSCTGVNFEQALKIIQTLHPTAALGLYPRDRAEMKIFSELPLQNIRGQFAAPFTFFEPDHILCVAAIRNLYFSQNEMTIYSGCGVTAESIYENELSELEIKRESVKRMMGINE